MILGSDGAGRKMSIAGDRRGQGLTFATKLHLENDMIHRF
jgi:hypothetical protein